MASRADQLAGQFAESSRELLLVVDANGAIAWSDDRAARYGLAPPETLIAHALPGCEDKARELCRRGATEALSSWELPLVVDGRPVTVMFAARPVDGQVALLGSVVAQDVATAVAETAGSIHEIVGLNRELARQKIRLEDSNLAVRALHRELEQHAHRLRESAEIKQRLVAGVSHEFRTPLHSILGLAKLLLSRSDGPLTDEQQTQITFIRDSADELSRMINEMLDLARIDAGSSPIRSETFEVSQLLGALRGTMAPLVPEGGPVELVFAPAPDITLDTDRGKLTQVLRNLIANAIKFTPRGSVRVIAAVDGDEIRFAVRDTGIGIPEADLPRIFEEFTQLDTSAQGAARGTGLGLPLAKKLTQSLGGRLEVESTVGAGSTFTVTIPQEHADVTTYRALERSARVLDPERAPVLVVEDDRDTVFAYERYLRMAGFQVLPCRTTKAARTMLERVRPSAILLDVMLEGEDTWDFLAQLKRDPRTHDIPVLVCTVMNRESQARALGADEFWLKPVDQDRLIRKLQGLASGRGAKVLAIDDDPKSRYMISRFLAETPYVFLEAADGQTGIALARSERPDVILLDFLLEEMTAFDVIDALKADPATRMIPVIIVTSQVLPEADRQRLSQHAEVILSKEHLSRELAINRIRDALRAGGIREREPRREP